MNKRDKIKAFILFKRLLPGLLPLFIFIVADELWGTQIGLLVALSFSLLELAYTYFKEKKLEKFIFLDLALLILLGGISYVFSNDLFFKLKPAIINLILCIILAYSAFGSNHLLLLMSRRYVKDIELNDYQLKVFSKKLKILCFIFFIHMLLIVYSAFFLSKREWAFISGGLFYLIFAAYILFEILKNWFEKRRYKNEEWLPLVNDKGEVIGKAPRSVCHQNPEYLHPVIRLFLMNKKGEVLLQKRSKNKRLHAGKWDASVGGHIAFGEELKTALKRETLEELGIKLKVSPTLLAQYRWETQNESELTFIFFAFYEGDSFIFNEEEVEDGKFFSLKQIEEMMKTQEITPNFIHEYSMLEDFFLERINDLKEKGNIIAERKNQ